MALASLAISPGLGRHCWLLGFLLCLTFVGNDLAMGPAWAAAADIGERHTGVLSGAMNMMASFMAAFAALATGHLFGIGPPRLAVRDLFRLQLRPGSDLLVGDRCATDA